MVVYILLIVAFWILPLPLALQILMTIFGSIAALISFGRFVAKCIDLGK